MNKTEYSVKYCLHPLVNVSRSNPDLSRVAFTAILDLAHSKGNELKGVD
jgi:hypothetical protein